MPTRYLLLIVAFVALIGGLVLLRGPEQASARTPQEIDLPVIQDYRDALVHYATIDRPDNLSRDLYITPGVAEMVANNSTARLPDGTVIVIEAHAIRGGQRAGIADNIHVAVKRDDWTAADYQNNERAGDWNYLSYNPETLEISDESVFECFDCHSNNRHIDFMFSRRHLRDYGQTDTLQEAYCNAPNRIPCF